MEQILIIKQDKKNFRDELFVNDIRSLGHFLNGLELLYKTKLLNGKDSRFNVLSQKEKQQLYRKEFRIRIVGINKNSPFEIRLMIQFLNESMELIDIYFSHENQEDIIKYSIGRFCNVDFDLEENKKIWGQIFRAISFGKKFIKSMNLYFEVK